MPYELELKDDVIVITLHQNQSDEEVKQMGKDIVELSGSRSYDVLIDATDGRPNEISNVPLALEQIKIIPFKRLAIFGPSLKLSNQRVKTMTDEARQPDRVKFFRKEEDAREWLES